jgi:predicted transcriptional regulator
MRAISLKLPDSLDRRLTELAEQRKTSRSALLRAALEAYANEPARSVTALAEDLAGSLEGPKDLSSSPRHFEGYGR